MASAKFLATVSCSCNIWCLFFSFFDILRICLFLLYCQFFFSCCFFCNNSFSNFSSCSFIFFWLLLFSFFCNYYIFQIISETLNKYIIFFKFDSSFFFINNNFPISMKHISFKISFINCIVTLRDIFSFPIKYSIFKFTYIYVSIRISISSMSILDPIFPLSFIFI